MLHSDESKGIRSVYNPAVTRGPPVQGGLDSFLLLFSESMVYAASCVNSVLVETSRIHLRAQWFQLKTQARFPNDVVSTGSVVFQMLWWARVGIAQVGTGKGEPFSCRCMPRRRKLGSG